MAKKSNSILDQFLSVTDYAFNAKFNKSNTYNCAAYNRQFNELLTDLLKSDFKNYLPELQVACLKALMIEYL